MQTQSDSGKDKATSTQEKKASIAPQPRILFDTFATENTTSYSSIVIFITVLLWRFFVYILLNNNA